MKSKLWLLLVLPVIVVSVAASQAGFSVVWDFEMKRPEAQQAIKAYVESHCRVTLWPHDLARSQANSKEGTEVPAEAQVICWNDAPAKR